MSKQLDKAGQARRAALGAGVGVGLSSIAMSAMGAMSATAATPDAALVAAKSLREPVRFKDPVWNREAAARLQADTNGEQVYGCCTGTVSGVRPGEAVRRLLGFEVFSTIRVVRQPDGSYDRMSKEVIFYTDPKTGAILDYWDNPYTSERVKVVDVANDPYNWIISDYIRSPPLPGTDAKTAPPPAVKKPFLLNWQEMGPDTVILAEDFHGYYPNKLDPKKWPRESGGPMNQTSELFRYFISRADLEDPTKTHLPYNGSWVRVTPWLPWMLMGQAPGHILYSGVFKTYRSLDSFSPAVLERVRKKYPQYLTAPTKWYGPSLSSLEHYALEQTPAPVK